MAPKAAAAVPATKLRLVTSSCFMSSSPEDVSIKSSVRSERARHAHADQAGNPRPFPLRKGVLTVLEALPDFNHWVRTPVFELDVRRNIVLLALEEMKDLLDRSVTFAP